MNKVPRAVVFADDSLVTVVVVVVLYVVVWHVLATVAFATIVVEVVERQHVTAVIAAPIVVGATCADITMCCKYPVVWAMASWHRCPGTTVVAYNAVCVAEVVVMSLVITGPRVTNTEQIVVATAD